MINTRSMFHRNQRRSSDERGSAYVEYFLTAAAMAAAAMWFFGWPDHPGSYQGVRDTLNGQFNTQMSAIAGSVHY